MLYRDIIAVESEWILIKYFRYFPMPEYIYIEPQNCRQKSSSTERTF